MFGKECGSLLFNRRFPKFEKKSRITRERRGERKGETVFHIPTRNGKNSHAILFAFREGKSSVQSDKREANNPIAGLFVNPIANRIASPIGSPVVSTIASPIFDLMANPIARPNASPSANWIVRLIAGPIA